MNHRIIMYILLIVFLGSCSKEKPISLIYSVKSGDYLGKIADDFNVRVIDIKEWNKLDSDNIIVGQKLNIYYPSNRTDSLKFGMTTNEVKMCIGIPPRDESFSKNDTVKYLTYNIDSKNIGLINNNSIESLKYYEIETVDFGFVDDTLSFISYDYRGIEFQEYYDYMISRGFSFKERGPLNWDGKGVLYGEEVFVDLANMFESGYVWCTFFRNSPKILEMFNIEAKSNQ